MTSTWQLTNGDGYNTYVTTMQDGVDADTEILLINPTCYDVSVFINNPGREDIEFRGTNIPPGDIVGSDFIRLIPDVKVEEYSNGFTTSITAIVFITGGIVGDDVKISILERLR